jgi:hypothetical protein
MSYSNQKGFLIFSQESLGMLGFKLFPGYHSMLGTKESKDSCENKKGKKETKFLKSWKLMNRFSSPMLLYGAFVLPFTYSVIQYVYCEKVRISNSSKLSKVCISNLSTYLE